MKQCVVFECDKEWTKRLAHQSAIHMSLSETPFAKHWLHFLRFHFESAFHLMHFIVSSVSFDTVAKPTQASLSSFSLRICAYKSLHMYNPYVQVTLLKN